MTINGSDLMLFVDKGGVKKSIAYATNHTLEVSADTKETSTKDNGNGIWQNSELGMMSWTTSSENLCSDSAENGLSYNDLFEIFLSRQTVDIVFSLQSNNQNFDIKNEESFTAPSTGWSPDATNNYHGKAYITSLSLTAQNGEKATFSVSLQGAGALIKGVDGIQKKTQAVKP